MFALHVKDNVNVNIGVKITKWFLCTTFLYIFSSCIFGS